FLPSAVWPTLKFPSYSTCCDFLLMTNQYGGLASPTVSNAAVGQYVTRPEWNVPPDYAPKLNRVGNASRKIFLSEGARFIAVVGPGFTLTYTQDSNSIQFGGACSDQRPYVAIGFNRSRVLMGNYADKQAAHQGGSGKYLLAAYRHGTRKLDDAPSSYRMN